MKHAVAAIVACVACARTVAPSPAPPPPTEHAAPLPISEPAEYQLDRVSRAAGEAIFVETGLGDPYGTGIAYPIWLGLLDGYPQLFGATPDALAAKFGFVARPGELPLGMHLTTDPFTGVSFVVTSCALCHAERIRWTGGEALVVGLGNKRVQVHAYDRAFAAVLAAPGFSAARLGLLADAAAARARIAWPVLYRDAMVGAAFAALRARATERAELHARTRADPPGRVAVIESFAIALRRLTHRPVTLAADVGWAKVPDVIGYGVRTTLSWDASQHGAIDLLAVEADLAAGARVAWVERHPFQGPSLGAYLRQPAPRPAFPGAIDRARAARGRVVFERACADCHGHYAADGRVTSYDEPVIALADLGTDPARVAAPTASFEAAANDRALTRGYTRFTRSLGYVPPVLTNVWARAPYGHAGQWPSLAVLATAPAQRPTRFTVDLDAPYDLSRVGVAVDTGAGYTHDATRPGFAVTGHPFLAELGAEAGLVIEYLKTL